MCDSFHLMTNLAKRRIITIFVVPQNVKLVQCTKIQTNILSKKKKADGYSWSVSCRRLLIISFYVNNEFNMILLY